MSELPQNPGWYSDPEGKLPDQAYWDGEKWTGETRDAKPNRKAGLFRRVMTDPSEWSFSHTVLAVVVSVGVGIILVGLPGLAALYPAQILLDAPRIDSLDPNVQWPLVLLMSLIWPVGFGVSRLVTAPIRPGVWRRIGYGVVFLAWVTVWGQILISGPIGSPSTNSGSGAGLFEERPGEMAVNVQARNRGDDPFLDRLWDECESGLFESCDLLFLLSSLGSDYETFGATCGDRGPAQEEYCIITHGDGVEIDSWRERCRAGDPAACDLLFQFSPLGSEDERLAKNCGGVAEESDLGCIVRFGL